ncbi:MAG: SprT-like domain-containing protein [Cellulomonas sp.]
MDIDEARLLAIELMRQHQLTGWRVVFDRARTRAGICRFDRQEIGLSRVLTALHPPELVRETILHEIAHALTGPGHAHDAVWRATARGIGSDGRRCVSASAPRPPAPWVGECARGHEVTRHRRPARPTSCVRCNRRFDPTHLITWRFHGRQVPLSAAYQAELLRLHAVEMPGATIGAPSPSSAEHLPIGTLVVLGGGGRFAGQRGFIVKSGRTRYHVQTRVGLITVPFALVRHHFG